MTRNEAVEVLKDLQRDTIKDELLIEAISIAIRELDERAGWISIDDRLPSSESHKTVKVLARMVTGDVTPVLFDTDLKQFIYVGDIGKDPRYVPPVTDWMPDTSQGKYPVNIFRDRFIDRMEKESFHAENDMWSGQVVALEDVERILRGVIG